MVTIRLDLRVPQEMYDHMQAEARSRKLSFEGLLLMYVEDRMKQSRESARHTRPTRT